MESANYTFSLKNQYFCRKNQIAFSVTISTEHGSPISAQVSPFQDSPFKEYFFIMYLYVHINFFFF